MDDIAFLAQHLNLENYEVAAFIIRCFNEYSSDFLVHNTDVLDPDFAQIRLRVRVTMKNRQDEHAASFVLDVLGYLHDRGYIPEGCTIEEAVSQIHQRLCMLQSLRLGNAVWIEDRRLEDDLHSALLREMEKAKSASRFLVY
ncbi:uncharacterized protein B0H64DRAFT_374461 [Chaetomium fimeti]|uniref:Uncharacterized protein n=1 Tax=Chaetomium fimeti TaxID=1854472 RepID=A0AAE0HHK3_9PEZI|nr:hypothetical protein B0H64DRAFT_374461 [Chaetomium fimeti]